MKFTTYVPLAIRTCKELPLPDHINHMALGVTGEMGEIIDQLKKAYIYNKPLDQVNIVEEVGDVAWYVAGFVAKFGTAEYMEQVPEAHAADEEAIVKAKARVTHSILGISHAFSDVMGEIQTAVEQGNTRVAKRGSEVLCAILYALSRLLDVDLEQAYDVNIAKLAKRYGDKYSDYAAQNRDLAGERAVLEAGTAAPARAASTVEPDNTLAYTAIAVAALSNDSHSSSTQSYSSSSDSYSSSDSGGSSDSGSCGGGE